MPHMTVVYNEKFRTTLAIQHLSISTSLVSAAFLTEQAEPKLRFGLTSRFPDSSEFDGDSVEGNRQIFFRDRSGC